MSHDEELTLPIWAWVAPALAIGLLALKYANIVPAQLPAVLVAAAVLLGAAVFAAVHHAEILALKLGEPFGSILLAVAVTVIEVALIVSLMLSAAPGTDNVARDTIFATVMIVLNGVVGLCLVLGGHRHYEQTFQLQAASSALAVLGTMAIITLVLPNYTIAARGPYFSPTQLVFVGAMSFALWCIFVFVQTISHRSYFLDEDSSAAADPHHPPPTNRMAVVSFVLLIASLVAVVLLSKLLTYPLDKAITGAGLPQAFVGVVIATVVLLPEGTAAVRSAIGNRLQNSINLSLGSAIASIGLTIPIVALVSLLLNQQITLGIQPEEMTLLLMTLFVSALTLGTGRSTVLQGAVHLVIFAIFLLLSAVP